MSSIVNPSLFLADESVKGFEVDQRVDLLADNVPTVSSGRYVCWQYKVPRSQVVVVKGIAVYALQRIQVGAADESMQYIAPENGNGWFSFEPAVNGAAPYIVEVDFNAPRIASGTLNNNDRQRARGLSNLSMEPQRDAHLQWGNPLRTFVAPPDSIIQVIFSILPTASASGFAASGRYTIGVNADPRVDFAGALVVGQQLSAQHYQALVRDAQEKK